MTVNAATPFNPFDVRDLASSSSELMRRLRSSLTTRPTTFFPASVTLAASGAFQVAVNVAFASAGAASNTIDHTMSCLFISLR